MRLSLALDPPYPIHHYCQDDEEDKQHERADYVAGYHAILRTRLSDNKFSLAIRAVAISDYLKRL